MKYYVVADIHSYFDIFHEAISNAGYFKDADPKKLVVCGDLFDRGNQAKELQSFILSLIKKDEVILIRGNHEDLFLRLIKEDYGMPLRHSVRNGTYGTALQLTGLAPHEAYPNIMDFVKALKTTPYYTHIIPSTIDFFETEKYIFVHGYIPVFENYYTGHPLYEYDPDWRHANSQDWKDARWRNGIEVNKTVKEHGKTIVCGHWHTSYGHSKIHGKGDEFGESAIFSPFYEEGLIALDACTAYSHMVNCIVLED